MCELIKKKSLLKNTKKNWVLSNGPAFMCNLSFFLLAFNTLVMAPFLAVLVYLVFCVPPVPQ